MSADLRRYGPEAARLLRIASPARRAVLRGYVPRLMAARAMQRRWMAAAGRPPSR